MSEYAARLRSLIERVSRALDRCDEWHGDVEDEVAIELERVEMIVGCAVRGRSRFRHDSIVTVWTVEKPGRHCDLMGLALRDDEDHEQGFVTDRGRFVDRREAWAIAEAAGQIVQRCGGDGPDGVGLFSENLW